MHIFTHTHTHIPPPWDPSSGDPPLLIKTLDEPSVCLGHGPQDVDEMMNNADEQKFIFYRVLLYSDTFISAITQPACVFLSWDSLMKRFRLPIFYVFLTVSQSHKNTKTNKELTPLYWVTCSSSTINMCTVVYFELVPHTLSCGINTHSC